MSPFFAILEHQRNIEQYYKLWDLYNSMVGTLYPPIVRDQITDLREKILSFDPNIQLKR